jgi:hypothetical protein
MTESVPTVIEPIPSPGGQGDCVKKMLHSAEEAVDLLVLRNFVRDNKNAIYKQLEDCDARVSQGPSGLDPDAAFIAQSLPLISGVIHVGSTRENFEAAATWVQKQSPHAEPASLLSTLVLLYVVDQGWQDADVSKDADKKTQWGRIYQRAQWLCER